MIFAFVALQRQAVLTIVFPTWAVLMAAIAFLAPGASHLPLLGNYYCFFAGGTLIQALTSNRIRLLQLIGLLASVAASVQYARGIGFGYDATQVSEVELNIWTILVVASFALVALVLWRPVLTLRIPGSALAGALTYPIYLLHAHLGYIALDALAGGNRTGWVVTVMAFCLVAAAYFLHKLVEVRLNPFWRALGEVSVGRFLRLLERPKVRA